MNLAMLWFPVVAVSFQRTAVLPGMIRKEASSPACTVSIENPQTALEATLGKTEEPLVGARLSVGSVKFHCAAGYTTDGEKPRDDNRGFEVECGGQHVGCLPIQCSLIPLTIKGVKPSVPLDVARVGEWVTFTADEDHSFDGRTVIAATTSKRLLCTGEGWVENLLTRGPSGGNTHVSTVSAEPVMCAALAEEEVTRMNVESPGAQGVSLHKAVQLTCLTGFTFGYADGLDACGECPRVLQREHTVPCALSPQSAAALATAALQCRPIQCDVPEEAAKHTASVTLPQKDGEMASRLAYGDAFEVQCEDTARPGGDADGSNEQFPASCGEDGIQPPVGWCQSVECKEWQGKDQAGAKGEAGTQRTERCPGGESVDGGDRRLDGNDGAHEYECRKDPATDKFWWHCVNGRHCGASPLIDHTADDVTHPCKPVECPMREVGEHTSKLVWEEKGELVSLSIEGSAVFGTHVQAGCLRGYDLHVDGTTPWPEDLSLEGNQLWADLGLCNDHAAFASLEPKGDALGCEPTDGYCPALTAKGLAEIGLEMFFDALETVEPAKRTYAEVVKGVKAADERRTQASTGAQASKTGTVGTKGSVQCLDGYHYTGAYGGLELSAELEISCTSRHDDATPGVGGGIWLPNVKSGQVPLGKEPVCVPIVCTAPETHAGSGALREGTAEVKWGEVATYRCPEGQVMVEVGGEQRLVPEKPQKKYGGGKCTSQYVKSSKLEWQTSTKGSGLMSWRCFANCGNLEDQVPLKKIGLALDTTGVFHHVPDDSPRYSSLLETHGTAYGTLSFAASDCFGATGRTASLRCGDDGEWRVQLGEGPAQPVSQVWQAEKYVSVDFVRAMGKQFHVLNRQHKRGGKCLAAKGDGVAVVECDPLAIEQRFDYPEANSYEDLAGVVVSAQTGQCLKLTGGGDQGHAHSTLNRHGEIGGREGQFVLGPCGDHCKADEEARECSRGDLLTETRPLKWGTDPECPFFISMQRPEGTPAEFHAAFEHPCIAKKEDGSCSRRSRRAGGLGAVGINARPTYGALEQAGVVVNYKERPEDVFSILVE